MSIPATTGEFGVLPGHVPTVAQLKPGVLAVHTDGDKNVKKARPRHADGAAQGPSGTPRGRRATLGTASVRCSVRCSVLLHSSCKRTTRRARSRCARLLLWPGPGAPAGLTLWHPLALTRPAPQFFVSSGFAFVHADSSTDVCAVEAVPLEQLDPDAVKQGLADYQAKLVNAKDDYERAAAQVGIEVTSAMIAALGTA